MSAQIKNISLKFNCYADWDNMPYVDGVKHCDHCQKKVYDFTNARQAEFLKILAENNNNICGRFTAEQLAQKHTVLPAWKKWASAALVLIGINVFNSKANAQNAVAKSTKNKITVTDEMPPFSMGAPIPFGDTVDHNGPVYYEHLPEFTGGQEKYLAFIKKNLRYTSVMKEGRVVLRFDVSKDGVISNYTILRSPT